LSALEVLLFCFKDGDPFDGVFLELFSLLADGLGDEQFLLSAEARGPFL